MLVLRAGLQFALAALMSALRVGPAQTRQLCSTAGRRRCNHSPAGMHCLSGHLSAHLPCLQAHLGPVTGLAVSVDGTLCASISTDSTVKV